MKIFACGACGQTTYFHNVQCVRCGHRLGFAPDRMELLAFELTGEDCWRPLGVADSQLYERCGNYRTYEACNWMIRADSGQSLCQACRLNQTIPDLSVDRNLTLWRRLQIEKNRLVYGLLRLGLPVKSKQQEDEPEQGLAFEFLVDSGDDFREGSGVIIGHADGVITLDVAEADDAVREDMRQKMAEPYRTILGHFRHESGHYYWDRLVRDSQWLEEFRQLFGDERESYQDALDRHYSNGPPGDWPSRFVSAYASMHAWEDWAESWAHYLHIVDTLETAWQFGLHLAPRVAPPGEAPPADSFDPIGSSDFEALIEHWLPVTLALNSLNHSMGQADAYPFVLAAPAVEKLELVHRVVRQGGTG